MRKTGSILLLLTIAGTAAADLLVVPGRRLRGGVQRDDPSGVAWNPYFSRDPGMVFDVETFPREQVKEVVLEEAPLAEYLRRAAALGAGDADAWVELARWCKERKLEVERRLALVEALKLDREHEEALKDFGRSKFPRFARGHPDFDPEAKAAIDACLEITDPEERGRAHGRLKREHAVDLPREYLDRIVRARAEPKGLQTDRALTLRAVDHPGVYTLFVPETYDPRRTWPLVLALHGGGVGGREGDAVVGSGPDAMPFYLRQAAARSWLVACPTARVGGWASAPNREFLRSALEEIQLLYHVDLNRVYLTGHSMGGFGAWYYGQEWAERFAAISPMAGGGGNRIGRLVDTLTPVFVFHGADDRVVGPDWDRRAARELAKTDHDFVYTELAGVGHGFPQHVQAFLFDFFEVRRRAPMRGGRARPATAAVQSSFEVKVSRDEILYLGDPLVYGASEDSALKDLLRDVELGGGKAAAAAGKLGELADVKAVKPLGKLLRHPQTPDDVKVQAARALGLIGHEDGYPGLAAGLRSEHYEVFTASARAMAAIRAKKSGEALVGSLAALDRILDGKRYSGNHIEFPDWERWLPAYTAVVEGLGRLRPEGAPAALERSVVEHVLRGDWVVDTARRVRQDPEAVRRELREALQAALAGWDDPLARELAGSLR